MKRSDSYTRFAAGLAHFSSSRPWLPLALAAALSLLAGWRASTLTVNMQMANMLPASSPVAQAYLRVSENYAEANTVIALEGPRDRIVAMARVLEDSLEQIDGLYNVQASLPVDYLLDYGLMLQKPGDLARSARSLADPSLLGLLRGMNDDYEREYTDDGGNLARDELDIARSMLGTHRSLELLEAQIAGWAGTASSGDAARALLIGEPWQLSLDRRMLLISIMPEASLMEQEELIEVATRLEALLEHVRPSYPEVAANLTGAGPLQKDEIESLSSNTLLLTLLALLLIYLLLARAFRGWLLPLLAIVPLAVGIVWTMGAIALLFGSLNIFTAMIMLVLMGLGIDFSIHLVSRYYEARAEGGSVLDAARTMIDTTGRGVLTGGLTTSVAFFALMIADTRGVYELGVASGLGVLLTLLAVLSLLPALLALRDRGFVAFQRRRGREIDFARGASMGSPRIGAIAVASYRRPVLVLTLAALLIGLASWGALENQILYDWLELEPEGLKNVQLQKEIPKRYGMTDLGAWSIAPTVAAARQRAEAFRELPSVGAVSSISDLLPDSAWLAPNARHLAGLRQRLAASPMKPAPLQDPATALQQELVRYWDNLDLMSNLAFQQGIDRVVRTIDAITGYDSESNSTDTSAVLPSLVRMLQSESLPASRIDSLRSAWLAASRPLLLRMAAGQSPALADVPPSLRRDYLPKGVTDSGPFRSTVNARRYLFEKEALERFNQQAERIDSDIISMPKISLVMMEETLRDGRDGALLALLVISLLLFLHFRSPVGLIALLPLIGGSILMLGAMFLAGIQYNFMNLIAVPIILGIGIDDGVHALHRWREQGDRGEEAIRRSFSFVGRAIALTSATTMIGFGNLGFYAMRGIATFGIFLFLGVGFCFVTTLLLLPAVLRLVEGGRGKKAS